MNEDQREIIRRANLARQRGDLYGYFRRFGVAGDADQMVFGPELTHGPEDVRE